MKGMYKNKITFFILFAILLCILCGCHKKEAMHYTVDYGNSSVYTKAEMDEVVRQLDECENPYHCPHGRPTFVILSEKELAKEFLR